MYLQLSFFYIVLCSALFLGMFCWFWEFGSFDVVFTGMTVETDKYIQYSYLLCF